MIPFALRLATSSDLRGWSTTFLIEAFAFCALLPASLFGQDPAKAAGEGENRQSIKINLRGEVPIAILLEYVSQRTKAKFVYDDATVAQKKIVLQIPEEIPLEHLEPLLHSALQISGLAVADTDRPGLRRIIAAEKVPQVALPLDEAEKGNAYAALQLFRLKNADPTEIKTILAPFLATPSGSIIPLPGRRAIIVADVVGNLRRIDRLLKILDEEQLGSTIRFVRAKHVAADELAKRLEEIVEARARVESPAAKSADGTASKPATSLEIAVDPRTSQLILVGLPPQIEAAVTLLESLDVPLESVTRFYRLQFISDKQLADILEPWAASIHPKPPFEMRSEGGRVVIATTEVIHRQIARLLTQIDSRETSTRQSPIRFYKIKNVPVFDILQTLNSLQGGFGGGSGIPGAVNRRGQSRRSGPAGNRGGSQGTAFPLAGASTQSGNTMNGINPGDSGRANDGYDPAQQSIIPNQTGISALGNPVNGYGQGGYGQPVFGNPAYGQQGFPPFTGIPGLTPGLSGYPVAGLAYERGIQSPLGNAQVTADVGSNTLIIIAEPEVQQAYQQLIEFLDKRRPQVMIEAKVVVIDTSDDFTLGVEISGGDRQGARRLFAFSSYGLSTVNPINGNLTITPGTGFNGTLVDPSTADMVVRALTTHRRAKVLSSPKILVDDNAEGTLESVNEVPFTSINASQTVSTTSFAGFAKAGTTIKVTPTISEKQHVNLDYIVTLNSFTGTGTAGVPPPRQTNEIGSRVTVPDGYTIIVGGLTQKNVTANDTGIPYLETIPVIRDLTSLYVRNSRDQSLFIFLRPVVLKDDKFRDLRFLSKRDAYCADEGHNFPSSEPIFMNKSR